MQTDKATTFEVAHSIAARVAHFIALPLAHQSRYRQDNNQNTFENYPLYGVNQPLGLLLFPDKVSMSPAYTLPYHDVTTVNTNITASQLDEYLDAGCVFLPCAGGQDGRTLTNQGTAGPYWSSTSFHGDAAYYLVFVSGRLSPAYYDGSTDYKTYFYSVRLVREP